MQDRERRPMTRREFICLAASAGFLAGPEVRWLFGPIQRRTVTGTVYGGSRPLPGVRVSDGLRVVATDERGKYALDVGEDSGRFIFVTTPSGYWTEQFHVPTAKAAEVGRADFRLEPREQPDRFRFVFWTDIHLEQGGIRIEKFKKTIDETNALRPAFVWAQGDICLEGNAGKDYLQAISALEVPIRNGAGNHEMIVKASNPREAFESLFGPTCYSFDWGRIHCVVLDGNDVKPGKEDWTAVRGRISDRDLAWLEADLAAKPAGMPVIAGIHIPVGSTILERHPTSPEDAGSWVVQNGAAARKVLKAHGTRLVLQGHLHENERAILDGIEHATTQAVAGSWWKGGEGFERGVDASPRGFRVVEVDGTQVRHRFVSSGESRVDAAGDLGPLFSAEMAPPLRGKACFVFNCHDAPSGATARGRIDEGEWKDMPPHPAVNHGAGLIMPHHYLLELDASAIKPGKHEIRIEVSSEGGLLRHREEITFLDEKPVKMPLVYCTDLYHPHEDPDDHFDLAALLAIPEIDVRAIILDGGARQKLSPGTVPVRQLLEITGRQVPVATGLSARLKGPSDAAKDQPAEFQGGVDLILRTLKESPSPVSFAAVGSLRDVAAAYNRDPDFFASKTESIFAFIGDAHSAPGFDFREYNVTLDVSAFKCILESGLPVYWVPCFDGGAWKNGGRASFWRAAHRDLLAGASDPLKQYFIYALLRKAESDPTGFIRRKVDPAEWEAVLSLERNLWCCAVFTAIAGRRIIKEGSTWRSVPRGASPGGEPARPFAFERALVRVDDTGMVHYPEGLPRYCVERFRVADPPGYAKAMTALTAELLASLGRG